MRKPKAPGLRQELQQQTPQNLSLHGTLTHEECATILHGLRLIQTEGRIEGCAAGDCEHFEDTRALTNEEIDVLAERINFDPVLSKTWNPAECPNYTQLVAVTAELQEAHDVHVWDGGVDDPNHKDGTCHMCAVLSYAKAQIDAHKAKIAAHNKHAALVQRSSELHAKLSKMDGQTFLTDAEIKELQGVDAALYDPNKKQYYAIEWTWPDGDDDRFFSGAYMTESEATELRTLIDSKAEEADLTAVEVFVDRPVNQDFNAAKAEVLDALADVLG